MDYTETYENRFSTAVLACGILSVVTVFTGILPSVFGGLGVLFFLLGRRENRPGSLSTSLGLAASVVGLLIGLAMIALAVVTVIIPYLTNPEQFAEVAKQYQAYGIDLEALLQGAYPSM